MGGSTGCRVLDDAEIGSVLATTPATVRSHASRALATLRAAQPKNAMNPRDKNLHGHIIRLRDAGGNVAGTRFNWEMVVLAGTGTTDTPDPANNSATGRTE